MTHQEQLSNPGYVLDVPVTLSVAVRGPGLSKADAKALARRFADWVEQAAGNEPLLTAFNAAERASGQTAYVTEATLTSPTDESVETLDTLEAEL